MKQRTASLLLWALLLFLSGCSAPPRPIQGEEIKMRHASLLRMEESDSFTQVCISDVWHPGQTMATYLLVPQNRPLPSSLPEGIVVRTPIQRAALTSSVHAALLLELQAGHRIAALSDTDYIVSPEVRKLLQKGIHNLGTGIQPDIEVLRASRADALFVSPFENAGHGTLDRLNIPLIECADYMETSPLGRAEWMRFYGRLVGEGRRADSLFAKVEQAYAALRQRVAQAPGKRPTVLCDLRTGSIWYQPGGASTMGRFIEDAGGDYLWADRPESGSLSLDLETVFARAGQADLWLVKYGKPHDLSYQEMATDCAQYRQFLPWKKQRVWACNTLKVPFYEEVPFHPERLLQELAAIFHPQTAPLQQHRYYTPLPGSRP